MQSGFAVGRLEPDKDLKKVHDVGVAEIERQGHMMAQPFALGDNDTVVSATLSLLRTGAPRGTVHVDLFDDSGSGTPGVSLGRLGSIAAMSIELYDPDGPILDQGGDYVFTSAISGLTPNEEFYIFDISASPGDTGVFAGLMSDGTAATLMLHSSK